LKNQKRKEKKKKKKKKKKQPSNNNQGFIKNYKGTFLGNYLILKKDI